MLFTAVGGQTRSALRLSRAFHGCGLASPFVWYHSIATTFQAAVPPPLHEPADAQPADLTIHPTDAEQVAAFERGLASAHTRAIARGMVLKGKLLGTTLTGEQLMAKPWLGEGQLVALMRDKADDQAEDEAAAGGNGGGDGGGGGGGDGGGGGGGDGDDESDGEDGDGSSPVTTRTAG